VIAASAGNHAQGVAYHAGKLGIRAQICMPLTTPLIKVSATRGYGADVILQAQNYDEAYEESCAAARPSTSPSCMPSMTMPHRAGKAPSGWNSSNSTPTSKPSSPHRRRKA